MFSVDLHLPSTPEVPPSGAVDLLERRSSRAAMIRAKLHGHALPPITPASPATQATAVRIRELQEQVSQQQSLQNRLTRQLTQKPKSRPKSARALRSFLHGK
jgi:hypothetical protein